MSESLDPGSDNLFKSGKLIRPLLIFDGDCGFCRFWVDAWHQNVRDKVDFAPFQEVEAEFPEISHAEFNRSVQLVEPGGQIYAGAEAVYRLLSFDPNNQWLLDLYQKLAPFRAASEWFYRLVARNRPLFSKLTEVFFGKADSNYWLARFLFLRLLGLVYFIAFASFSTQVLGLIGSHGILPANLYLELAKEQAGDFRFYIFPTLAWFDASDVFLQFLCIFGALSACLAALGLTTGLALTICWLFYLSLVTVGGEFLTFQWDGLLLEVGFLSIFLAPWRFAEPPWTKEKKQDLPAPSIAVIWLLRLVLFKLVFMSGAVKLLSGDPTYRDLTALTYHWWTQPLPVPLAWYLDKLPMLLQKIACAGMFFFELLVPWTIFAPRKLRIAGSFLMIFFQVLIILSGNYTFFNWLTIAMALLLIDDKTFACIMPKSIYSGICQKVLDAGRLTKQSPWRFLWLSPLVLIIATIGGVKALTLVSGINPITQPVLIVNEFLLPFRIVNDYGVFAVMTKERKEIIVQGSNDGKTWLTYEFPYKPGDLRRAPPMVAPLQPRLDWQMWFAALGTYHSNPWFTNFMVRLLQGSPDVLHLLATNPFPNHPPKYVRALLYDYHFSKAADKAASGNWWQRSNEASYFPKISITEKPD